MVSSRGWLGLIPARSGSKSIPRKNTRPFLGRPLLQWTVQSARESGVFDRLILSTDSPDIAAVGRDLAVEVPFLRPDELAQDTTPTAPVIRHAVRWLEDSGWRPDYVMVLEPTSPARQAFHVREAAELLAESGADSLASVSLLSHHYVPEKLLKLHDDGTVTGIDGGHIRTMTHRRQDLPGYHYFNGLIFACRSEWVLQEPPTLWGDRIQAYIVDSEYCIDLDTLGDWAVGEARMRQLLKKDDD